MIIVRITMNVLSEKRLEATQTLLSMISPTEKETGCVSYAVFSDIDNNNRFNILEEWETYADLEHHLKSHRFGVLLGSKTLLKEPIHIQIYTISGIQGIEAVNAIRKKRLS